MNDQNYFDDDLATLYGNEYGNVVSGGKPFNVVEIYSQKYGVFGIIMGKICHMEKMNESVIHFVVVRKDFLIG
jgi:hypothetical protein